ncbi:EAL domain-containing protein [Enterococcus casseliflavus]|nr:EAL domain-containing protein [Enterococcus casseliflavus]MBF0014414.1 EAL domain-containing protein [Enterococcus casseliflavus]
MEMTDSLSIFSDLYFSAQPLFNFSNSVNPIFGYELLLRTQETQAFPTEFFDRVILSKTLNAQLLNWYYTEIKSILERTQKNISVNLHPQQLYYPETFTMLNKLKKYHNQILIEITEHDTQPSIYKHAEIFLSKSIHQIKKMNFNIALDDVGTGIHTLEKLLPLLEYIDVIKFSTLSLKQLDSKEVLFLIEFWDKLSETRKVKLIVEGVDNHKIHHYLITKKIFLQQGYYLSKPIPTVNIAP